MSTPASATASLGSASWRFQRALGHLVAEAIAPYALVLSELHLLGTISAFPGATNAELARTLEITPQAANQLVLRLTERGLLERTPHPTVARGLAARLTSAGSDTLAHALAAAEAAYDELLAPLSPSEAAALVETLQRCGDAARAHPAPGEA